MAWISSIVYGGSCCSGIIGFVIFLIALNRWGLLIVVSISSLLFSRTKVRFSAITSKKKDRYICLFAYICPYAHTKATKPSAPAKAVVISSSLIPPCSQSLWSGFCLIVFKLLNYWFKFWLLSKPRIKQIKRILMRGTLGFSRICLRFNGLASGESPLNLKEI